MSAGKLNSNYVFRRNMCEGEDTKDIVCVAKIPFLCFLILISMSCVRLRYQRMMSELKHAFVETSDYRRRLQILTLSPLSIFETMKFFGVSRYMVKKSREIKKAYGIIPQVPTVSHGRRISDSEKAKIKSFYDRDEVSRMCPGMRDRVIERDGEGKKVYVQKRLLLGTMREMFVLYKQDESNPRVGFSTFATLRPRHCVLAGSPGTHNVCVCTYHQNVKLQLAALGERSITYRDLMSAAVCDPSKRDCMMEKCQNCPGEEGVREYLYSLDSVQMASEDITFKQWSKSERESTLQDCVENIEQFVDSLSEKVCNLTRHHYISKAQGHYTANLRENAPKGEAVVIGDFSENYTCIAQNAAQSYHWSAKQVTVHPFVAYWTENGVQCSRSCCFLSDDLKHSHVMVHTMQHKVVPWLRTQMPGLKKIHYVSDGCGGQYKNKFNFINVCYHEIDFQIPCEWHFFATSHGKNACDGVGGTVKRRTAQESLRREEKDQILDPLSMFSFLTQDFATTIHFEFVSREEVFEMSKRLKQRYSSALKIKGTQRFHRFTPVNLNTMQVRELSEDSDGTEVPTATA